MPHSGNAVRAAAYDPVLERDLESRLAFGNGRIGVRASLEIPTLNSSPRTYFAGLYDGAPDSAVTSVLVSLPDWTRLSLSVDGQPVEFAPSAERVLDLSSGTLYATARIEPGGGAGGIDFTSAKFASLADRSMAVQAAQIAATAGARVALEALMVPTSVALRLEDGGRAASVWDSPERGLRIEIQADCALYVDGRRLEPSDQGGGLAWRWSWQAPGGRPATFVRAVRFTRPDPPPASPDAPPVRIAGVEALEAHRRAWNERWRASGIDIIGDDEAQASARFAAYHLISAANPDDDRVSVAARGLTGDSYAGHVFWDTEIFLLPFYVLTWPEAARAMLMYRYHTLPPAREKARRLGYSGALYAWESTDTGEETTPDHAHLPHGEKVAILNGSIEQHISADVAYAVWQYWTATADDRFLLDAGAEIIVETARFWASRARTEDDGRYHIRDVIGPDEYHEHVDDNAFTNVMAQWNLETASEALRLVRERWPEEAPALCGRLGIDEGEAAQWGEIASRMYDGFDRDRGVFEQFQGYFELEDIDPAAYEPRTMPLDVMLGRERTAKSKIIKQADVVMLLALLGDRFTPDVRAANFRYYEPRCGHGSSLSPGMHALVAAQLGEMELARRYFAEARAIDSGAGAGNLAGGVHLGTLGSIWQTIVFGFAGLSLHDDGLRFRPHPPEEWTALSMPLRWRGSSLRIEIDAAARTLAATVVHGAAVAIEVNGDRRTVAPGERAVWKYRLNNGEAAR